MANIERILIVSGGIAGLTLATALHQQDFTAQLIERSPSWHAVRAGIAVQPNGMRILHALGMGAAVERAGACIRHWDFCDQHGDVLSETDLEALWGDVGPFIGIERAKLHLEVIINISSIRGCRVVTRGIFLFLRCRDRGPESPLESIPESVPESPSLYTAADL